MEKKDLAQEFAKKVADEKASQNEKPPVVNQRLEAIKRRLSHVNAKQAGQWIITGMNIAKEVGNALPNKSSTPLGTALQMIGAASIMRSMLWKSTADPIAQYARQFGLDKYTNETFVRIFFNTDLHTKFILFRVRVSDYKEIIDAQGPLGRFAFVKNDYSIEYDSTYYMRPDVQMAEVLEGLWTQYDGRLYVTIAADMYGRGRAEFSAFPKVDSSTFGQAANERLRRLIARHRKYREQKIPRSYVCHGPPGTGKTSFAMKFAQELGKRTLKLSAASLNHISIKDIDYLLRHLAPEFLIIDDVDKIQTGNALSTILEIVQKFKEGDGQTSLIMTANIITNFDPGFFRPNRVDTWLEFKLPELEERKEVIRSYCQQSSLNLSDSDVERLAVDSETLSHDYLREIVSELKQCSSFEEVSSLIKLMKSLLPKPATNKDKPAETPKT